MILTILYHTFNISAWFLMGIFTGQIIEDFREGKI